MNSRSATTKARLQSVALDLFEARGYRAVTVDDIAEAAGVSHMTFFRHFPSKDRVLLDDPFDPIIAEAIAQQSHTLPAIERVGRGLLAVVPLLGMELTENARRGIAIVAREPELAGGMAANMAATERAIVEAAAVSGDGRALRIATSALLAGIAAALMDWASDPDGRSLGEIVEEVVATVVPTLTGVSVAAFNGPTWVNAS